MDTVDQNKAVGATVAGEAESSRNKNRSRTPGRVLVYDCDQRTLQVQNESLVQCKSSFKILTYTKLTAVLTVRSRRL